MQENDVPTISALAVSTGTAGTNPIDIGIRPEVAVQQIMAASSIPVSDEPPYWYLGLETGSFRNGREVGQYASGLHVARGERVTHFALLPDHVDGAVTALVAHDLTVRVFSRSFDPQNSVTIEVSTT